jgi:hypothetical protein
MRYIYFGLILFLIYWFISSAVRSGIVGAARSFTHPRERQSKPSDNPAELPFDREKWQALRRYDPEIATIASKLGVLGDKWVDEFARAYLALSDKKYLPNIVHKIIDDARLEAKKLEQKLEQKKIAKKDAWYSLGFILSLFALAVLIVAAVGIGGKIWGH